ncbi:hypothetical protein A2U01_0117172, partial [Trifolium medium]|nr:hypothetical protein [Trifolium medium]
EPISVLLLQADSIGDSKKQISELWTWSAFEGMLEVLGLVDYGPKSRYRPIVSKFGALKKRNAVK